MADTMLEKAAKAMWEENRIRCARVQIELPEWGKDRPQLREDWLAFAKAALEAIREPSEEALIASGMPDADARELARYIWAYMVRAVLTEKA